MHTRPWTLWAAMAAAFTGTLFLQAAERGAAAGDRNELTGGGSQRIGLLDLERALEHCAARSGATAALARDRQAFDDEVATQRTKAKELARRMAKTPVGTQERYSMESRLRSMAKQTRDQTDQKNREFAERETQLRFDAYRQVRQAVAQYAAEHHLRLVLNHADEHADPQNAAALEEALASPVVFHEGMDITGEIVQALDAAISPAPGEPLEGGGRAGK